MGRRDPRVDAYIVKSPDFAKPILTHLRDVVHAACPGVDEDVKWSMPFFTVGGTNLCHMAAFKAHCAFGFWRGKELPGLESDDRAPAMGSLGRIARLRDLPSKRVLSGHIRAAIKLHESGTKPLRAKPAIKEPIAMPGELAEALKKNAKAKKAFEAFSPSVRREYLEWIAGAKRAATRDARIETAVGWIAEGKKRHWKYETC